MTAPPLVRRFRSSIGSRSESADRVMKQVTEAKARACQWKKLHRRHVVVTDAVAVVVAVTIAQFARFGLPELNSPAMGDSWRYVTACSIILAVIWLAALGLQESWDLSLTGIGSEEYRRVVTATAWAFGIIAVADLLLQLGLVRGYLAIALPVAGGIAGGQAPLETRSRQQEIARCIHEPGCRAREASFGDRTLQHLQSV